MIPRVEASLACMAQSATGPCRAAGPALSALPGRGSDRRATGLQARVTHLEQRHAAHRELVEGAVVAYPSPSRRLRFEVLGAGSPSNADTPGIKTEPALNITRLSSTCSSACCALRLAMATIRCVRALCACAGCRCPNHLPPPTEAGVLAVRGRVARGPGRALARAPPQALAQLLRIQVRGPVASPGSACWPQHLSPAAVAKAT